MIKNYLNILNIFNYIKNKKKLLAILFFLLITYIFLYKNKNRL